MRPISVRRLCGARVASISSSSSPAQGADHVEPRRSSIARPRPLQLGRRDRRQLARAGQPPPGAHDPAEALLAQRQQQLHRHLARRPDVGVDDEVDAPEHPPVHVAAGVAEAVDVAVALEPAQDQQRRLAGRPPSARGAGRPGPLVHHPSARPPRPRRSGGRPAGSRTPPRAARGRGRSAGGPRRASGGPAPTGACALARALEVRVEVGQQLDHRAVAVLAVLAQRAAADVLDARGIGRFGARLDGGSSCSTITRISTSLALAPWKGCVSVRIS